ncbi:MAG: class II aldolase/adducin family protein [Pseudomonadota bacterium]
MGDFERFSADIGRRLDLVQGAGGNTSIKTGGSMRIKASGAWLSDALAKPLFVDVDFQKLRRGLSGDFDDASLKALLASDEALRPSIETPLHALSPFAIVAHVHSASTIAWGVRQDARERLSEHLAGLDWAFVPYARPGAPLAKAVRKAFDAGRPPVLILANHGLVVAAETIGGVRALLDEVEERLAVAPAPDAPATNKKSPPPAGYRWAENSPCEFLAFDEKRLGVASKGSLYPDHVVFLGPALTVLRDARSLSTMIPPPKVAVVKGAGVLVREDLTRGALAMLDCLGLVMARIDPEAPVNYLSADDEAMLLGWDAETYRQALDRRAARE